VKKLVTAKADVNAKVVCGGDPLSPLALASVLAEQTNNRMIVEFLGEQGAK
jgi:hypothetical protein